MGTIGWWAPIRTRWTETSFRASYADGRDFRFPTTAPGRLLSPEGNSSVHPEEQPEGGTIWHHLARHGITFRNFGEGFELAGVDEGQGYKPTGARFLTNVPMPEPLFSNTSRDYPVFNMNIPDQYRATQFIHEIEEKYVKGGEPFPRFIYIHLPNDHMTEPRPQDGYPYEASYVADNDYALGRIVEFLSQTPWWREMAIFVTEDDAQGGRDHIDAHRTVFLGIGPYFKRNYVSHVNTSFPGMLKTIFRLLGLPPLNLFDAVASDLSDCFTNTPDYEGYQVGEGGCADVRSGGGAGAAGSAAEREDGRSGGGGAVRLHRGAGLSSLDVAHALSVPRPHSCGRRERSSRFLAGLRPARRQECRRGRQKCLRHVGDLQIDPAR